MQQQDWFIERKRLLERIKELEIENAELRKRLGEDVMPVAQKTKVEPLLSLQQKVELFSCLFRGREDVFARRWYSKTRGKAGYQPVCRNEWSPLCDKRTLKCADCPNRQFSPLTDKDVYRHLEGKDTDGRDVIGLYVLNEDNTCHLLCADFDDKNCEHGYQNDVRAFIDVCKDWNIPYSVERSRSGNGAHVWIFFESPIAAMKARKMGYAILTEAMNRDGRLSFKSYDRFFPNQDHLPEGGFGNLVALPLQGKARRGGNSVFVDETFAAYSDQWEYLLGVKRMSEIDVDAIIAQHANTPPLGELTRTSDAKPWEVPVAPQISSLDFDSEIVITKSNMLYLPLKQLKPKVLNHLKRIASFRNPEFYSRQAMRLSTYNVPRIISCAEVTDDYLALPRGCENAVCDFFGSKKAKYRIEDKTNHGQKISVTFKGELRYEQEEAVRAMAKESTGVLSGTTAFGKTVTAIGLIAKKSVNTLILVHTKALLDQWKKELEKFLDIEYKQEDISPKRGRRNAFSPIGCLHSTEDTLHGIIDIALMQSCVSDNEAKPFLRNYGMVIADECHHVSAVNFESVLKFCNARYVYGLTATPIRKDGHQPIIFMQCGSIRYTVDAKAQMAKQNFNRLLVPRFTAYRWLTDDKVDYPQLIRRLAEDDVRNNLIVEEVLQAVREGRSPIVLTSLTAHVATLAELLKGRCQNVVTLVGSEPAKGKRAKLELLQTIAPEQPLVIVATGKYVGEGFNLPRLDTLFMALPISWKGNVSQYAGRLHRDYDGKSEVLVYDYVDIHTPLCELMYRRRLKGYASIGYQIKTEDVLFGTPQPVVNKIYDGQNFQQPFIREIGSAHESIVIASPKIKIGRNSVITDRLRDLALNGIEIVVFTQNENEYTNRLQNSGITVRLKDKLSLCCAIIDRQTTWYGTVNILGYLSEGDNLIRLKDSEIPSALIDFLYH